MFRRFLKRFNMSAAILKNKSCDDFMVNQSTVDDILVYINGPHNSPYDGQYIEVHIGLSADYPFSPPDVTFVTPLWHPNVCDFTGIVGKCILDDNWKMDPEEFVTLVKNLQHILVNPSTENAVNHIASKHYVVDQQNYWETVNELLQITDDSQIGTLKKKVIETVLSYEN